MSQKLREAILKFFVNIKKVLRQRVTTTDDLIKIFLKDQFPKTANSEKQTSSYLVGN